MTTLNPSDYFGRLANTIYFALANETARRAVSDELALAEKGYYHAADIIDMRGSGQRKPILY